MNTAAKPRIIFLIPRLGVTDRGAEVFVYELTRRIAGKFQILVLVRSDAVSILLTNLRRAGVVVWKIPCVREDNWLINKIYSQKLSERILKLFHCTPIEFEMLTFSLFCLPLLLTLDTAVIFPHNGTWGAIIARLVRFFRGIPFVYTSHGGREKLVALQKPDIYFAIHPPTKTWLTDNFPHLFVKYIPNGVDTNRFTPIGEKAAIDLPRPIFVTAAALVPEKQVDLTIKAVGKLRSGSLLILGDGPLKESIRQLAESILGQNRFLLLGVSTLDMPKYLRSCDVFTLAAPWEIGIGLVQTEAMACGLPVVVNREPTIEQMIGQGGIVCDVKNTTLYATALLSASRKKFRNLPRKQALKYSWDKIAKIYSRNLATLVKNK